MTFIDIPQFIKPNKLDENYFYTLFTCLFCCFLAPFIVFWFVKELYLLAIIEAFLLIFLCCNLRRISINKSEILPRSVVLISIGCQLLLLTYYAGSSASLWSYPLLATYFFILPIRHANYVAIALVLPMSYILTFSSDSIFVLRYVSSIIATVIIANLIITINKNLQKELLRQSISDPLTHCYNRRHLDTTLEQTTHLYQRTQDAVSILLIDIDHFKQINDQLGHLVGDDILRQMVKTIQEHRRASDMLFRYGGEEFILLLPEANHKHAMLIAEKTRKFISDIQLPTKHQGLTVSIGVSEFTPSMSADDWIKQADVALYKAKNSGRNKVCSIEMN
ncbi:MAG: GGDEF domain-containing protein [Oceanospirillaceae bacterium]|nr:GGDEF domain-containing protein [Oceanospirillaceae bacterium]